MPQIPISLQLYTVRDDMAQDLSATLRRVAEIGYKIVELTGLNGLAAPEFKQLLDDLGLKAPSAHVSIDVLQGDGLGKIAEDYKLLGVETIVVPGLGEEWRQGAQGYLHTAEVLNEIAARLTTEGFITAYHNHAFEFTDPMEEGKSGWQILMDETDPTSLKVELDTYWLLHAGQDPVKIMQELGQRVTLLHLKDKDKNDQSFTPLGTGTLPLDAIVQAAESLGSVKYLIVEQDTATKQTPMEAIAVSFERLNSKGLV